MEAHRLADQPFDPWNLMYNLEPRAIGQDDRGPAICYPLPASCITLGDHSSLGESRKGISFPPNAGYRIRLYLSCDASHPFLILFPPATQ